MGRTYEALSHSRVKRDRDAGDEDLVPPTVYFPSSQVTPVAPAAGTQAIAPKAAPERVPDDEPESEPVLADTALSLDLSKDNNSVPFIEVGGPRGSKPLYGPLVADTVIPNPQPLSLEPAPSVDEAPTALSTTSSVAFFPLPERPPLDPGQVAAEVIAFHRPENAASAQYRGVLAGLAAQHPGVGCPLLVFTTVGHSIEAATVILNLAITRTREESKRLLVIEANHEQPLIAGRLGMASQPGLRELLNHSIPMNVALHQTVQPHLFVLPPGDPDRPVSHEAEARLPNVVDQLRRRFDWLLVNAPEWGAGGAAEWVGLGDAAYLVVRHDQWDTPEVEAAHEAIVVAGGKLRGYVTIRGK